MEPLPQTQSDETAARGVSEILAKANRADLPAMRTSLSFLTAAGAQLATALQKRNQEYDEALAALAVLPNEWVLAARAGQALPDLAALRVDVQHAAEQNARLESQLAERDQQLQEAQTQLGAVTAAKAATEKELADLDSQMNAMSAELLQVLEADETSEAIAASAEDAQGRTIEPPASASASDGKRVALTAAVAAIAAQSRSKQAELDALNAQLAELQSLVDDLMSDKQTLESVVLDTQAQLDAAIAELNDIDQQLNGLQGDLQASLGEGVPAPEPVAAADAAVPTGATAPAEAIAPVATATPVDATAPAEAGGQTAPADVAPQAAFAEAVAPETEVAAEQVDTPQVRRAATRIALASAISAAIARNRDQQTVLVESKAQLADLQVQFDAASCAQAEDEAELNDLENQLDTLNGQLQPLLADDTAPAAAEAAPAEADAAPDAGLQEEVAAQPADAQPADAQPSADATATPEPSPVETPQTRRAAKRTALAAAIVGVIARVNKKQADLETSQAQLADLQVQFDAASSAQAEDEAELNDLENQLDVLNGQLQPILVDEATPAAVEAISTEGDDATADAAAQPSADADAPPEPSPGKPSLMRRAATGAASAAALAANELEKQVHAFNSKLLSTPAADTAPAEADDAAPAPDTDVTPEPSPVETPQTRRTAKRAALAAAIAAVVARVNKKQAELEISQAQLADLQAQLDAATTAKAETEAQLAALEHQVNGVTSELEPLVTEEGGATPTAEGEEASKEGVSAKGAALGATAAAAVASSTKKQKELEEAQAQLTDLQAKLDAATAAQADTEAKLAGVEKQLDALAAELQPRASAPAVATVVEGEAPAGEAPVAEATGEGAPPEGEVAAAAAAPEEGPEAKAAVLVAAVAALGAKEQAASSELVEAQTQLAEFQAQSESLQVQLQARDAELAELQARMRASEPIQDAMSVSASLAGRPQFKTRAAGAALIVGVQPYLSPKVQGLSQVIGIASVRQQRLFNAGVGSFWELANLNNEELLDILQLTDLRAQEVYYDGIRAEATRMARETSTVGCIWDGDRIDDFEVLTGVGKVYEQRLYEAGICTYEQLININVGELIDIIHAPHMQTPDFGQWIVEAQQLLDERARTESS